VLVLVLAALWLLPKLLRLVARIIRALLGRGTPPESAR
jgi:hypothetical protein